MDIYAGRTIYLRIPPHNKTHLWPVLTNVDKGNKFIAVMVRTKQSHTDKTVILKLGDHPFIKHESSADYKFLKKIQNEIKKESLFYKGRHVK